MKQVKVEMSENVFNLIGQMLSNPQVAVPITAAGAAYEAQMVWRAAALQATKEPAAPVESGVEGGSEGESE